MTSAQLYWLSFSCIAVFKWCAGRVKLYKHYLSLPAGAICAANCRALKTMLGYFAGKQI